MEGWWLKARQGDEYDAKLFAEAKSSVFKLVDELEGEVCHCEICAEFCSDVVPATKKSCRLRASSCTREREARQANKL